ncbi:hypothetical protein BDF22DRAFT_679491 [Syncephalis plumigaleata]|nr:hypothetical protein BDF22DRAFT_679491 [Syncephalis plumigaleata]
MATCIPTCIIKLSGSSAMAVAYTFILSAYHLSLVVIPVVSAFVAIATARSRIHTHRPLVSSSKRTMSSIGGDNNGDDAYLRFLQQANAPLTANASTPISGEVAPHANVLTTTPSDAALATAQQRLDSAASGLCLITETESDLAVVHIPTSNFEITTLTEEKFTELLGANHEECTSIDVDEFFANAKHAAASVGLTEDATRWSALHHTLSEILATVPLKAWQVGRAADAWVYVGGILPGKGFIGIRARSVET